MADELRIAALLEQLGFTGEAAVSAARDCLHRRGLTNPRKQRVSTSKRGVIETALQADLARSCVHSDCSAWLSRNKPAAQLVTVESPAGCECCGGSANRRAMVRIAEHWRSRGRSRLIVVGGSPSTQEELRGLEELGVRIRAVDGTTALDSVRVRELVRGADLVLIWASTQLTHKVSIAFRTAAQTLGVRTLLVERRGVASLLETAIASEGKSTSG